MTLCLASHGSLVTQLCTYTSNQWHCKLQMGPYTTDPAQALTTMMEVAVETVNTVANIALETVQKMSAVTVEHLKAAAQQGEQHRCGTS